jgi:hypothetical protein
MVADAVNAAEAISAGMVYRTGLMIAQPLFASALGAASGGALAAIALA